MLLLLSAPPVATSYTLVGPSLVSCALQSQDFTLQPNGTATAIVTPSDNGAGGTFSPTTVTFSGPGAQTFKYTPGNNTGTISISVSDNGGLSDPSPLSVRVVNLHSDLLYAGIAGNATSDVLSDLGPYRMAATNKNFSSSDPDVKQYAAVNNLWGADYNTHNSHYIEGLSWGFRVPGDFVCTGLTYDANIDGAGRPGFWVGNFTAGTGVPVYLTGGSAGSAVTFTGHTNALQGLALDTSDNTFWTTGSDQTKIRHFSKAGVEITSDSISLSANANHVAIDIANDKIWCVTDLTVIKSFSLATGSQVSTFSKSSVALDGIGFDVSDGTLWITDDLNFNVHHYASNGTDQNDGFTLIHDMEGVVVLGSYLYITHDTNAILGNRILKYTKAGGYDRGVLNAAFGVSLWAKAGATNLSKGLASDQSDSGRFGSVDIATSTGKVAVTVYKEGLADAGGHVTLTSTATPFNQTTTFVHVLVTWDGATLYIYLDGVLDSSVACVSNKLGVDTGGFQIGGRQADGGGWNGSIVAPLVLGRYVLPEEAPHFASNTDAFYNSFRLSPTPLILFGACAYDV